MNIIIKKYNTTVLPKDSGYGGLPDGLTYDGLHTTSDYATEYEYMKILYWLILAKGHKRILEIGTNRGDGTWWFIKAAEKLGGHVTTVDPEDKYLGLESPVLTRVNMKSTDFFRSLSNDAEYDFIYVDGDHSFIIAFHDIYAAQRRVSPGGTIAVHDVRYNHGELMYQADKALMEIMRDTSGKWITYNYGHGMAIGEF